MNQLITSTENEKIKLLRKLAQKKYREDYGLFIIENLKTIHDALQAGIICESLFITQDLLQSGGDLLYAIQQSSPDYFIIDSALNRHFSSLETPPGIAAVYKKFSYAMDLTRPVIYLNGINDPGNIGTILRTALAFGFENILLDEHCADLYNPKTLQASKDAIFKLHINHDKQQSFLKQIKARMPLISTHIKESTPIQSLQISDPFCLILGSEAHGVSYDIQKMADQYVTIPLCPDMESLNVAVAAGILLFELSTKLSPAVPHHLSPVC